MEEVWIENNGYKISNYGRITRKNSDKLQKMASNAYGYVCCNAIFDDGFKTGSMHRAVAYAFLKDTYKKGLEVNHKDGNKQNNRVDNLEWVTEKENQQHESLELRQRSGENCYMTKLDENSILEIYNLVKEDKYSNKEIANMYNIDPSNVSRILKGETWRYLGLENINRKDKPIIGVNINDGSILEYESVRFSKEDGFIPSAISRCCLGNSKSGIHKGYKWSYKNIEQNFSFIRKLIKNGERIWQK